MFLLVSCFSRVMRGLCKISQSYNNKLKLKLSFTFDTLFNVAKYYSKKHCSNESPKM